MRIHKGQSTTASRSFTIVRVRRRIGAAHWGKLIAGNRIIPCAIGRTGISAAKREGDGASPRGVFRLIALYHRPDRPRPRTGLPLKRIRPDDGWCDAPDHRLYNQPVKRPFAASHEEMWRDDALYDLVIDIDWNRSPIIKGRGSAIFMHAARPGFSATAGCVALKPRDLRWLIVRLGPRTRISIA
ncbi:MAG: L,D-transpeptidase family protein [Beijerinckiaceae bacterium]